MHVPYEAQIVLVPRCLTYRLPPFFYQLEDLILDTGRVHRWTFGKAAHKLVEKFFGANLKMERVAAVLDANVQELFESELAIRCTRRGSMGVH